MKPVHVLAAILVTAVWGFNFVVIRVGLNHFPPLLLTVLRFAVAALPVLFVPRPNVGAGRLAAIGLFLFVGQFVFLFSGMAAGLPAGLASIAIQSQAFFTLIFAALALRERPTRRHLGGMAVAGAGLGLIGLSIGGDLTALGLGLVLAAAASWAVGNVLLRGAGQVDMFRMVVWMSLVPLAPVLALSLWLEGPAAIAASFQAAGWQAAGAVLYLGVPTTLFGFYVWGQLLKRYPAATVAPFSLLAPVFGTVSAHLVLGETFGPLRLGGMMLILAGLAVLVLPLPRWRRRPAVS